MAQLRRGGGRGRHGRHRDGLRAGPAGRAHAARRPGRRRAGRPTRARASSRPRRPSVTTRTGSSSCCAAGGHYEQLVPRARRRHGLGALRHPAARDARRATCRRGSGSPNARRARPRSAPTRRARWCRCSATVVRALHHPRGRARRRSHDVRGAPRARPSSTASRCAPARSTRCAPARRPTSSSTVRRSRVGGRDRGRRVDASARQQLGVQLPGRSGARPDRAPRRRRSRHRRVADRAAGVRPLHGAVGRSPRRGRRDGRGRGLRARRHRGRRATRSCARRCA